jgi:inhibitor of KinA
VAGTIPHEIIPIGDSAVSVRFTTADGEDTADTVIAARDRLHAAAIPGVKEVTVAFESVGVFYHPGAVRRDAGQSVFDVLSAEISALLESAPATPAYSASREVEVPVCYAAEFAIDLPEVAQSCGLTEADVIERHSTAQYRVRCIGFTPGFPYLSGLAPELAVPRRATPRTRVPAGSVGIGGSQTGIYTIESPGGWNIIGRTPLRLFDAARETPSLLQGGDCVRFRAISRQEFDDIAAAGS